MEKNSMPVASATAKAPKKGLKSSKVINKILFPQKNIMVIERTYLYPPKNPNPDENNARKRVYLPADTRDGWLWMFSSKDDYIVTPSGDGVWVVREYYVKKGHVYQYPKPRKEDVENIKKEYKEKLESEELDKRCDEILKSVSFLGID